MAKRKKTNKAKKGNKILVYAMVALLIALAANYFAGGFKKTSQAVVEPNPTIELVDSAAQPQTLTAKAGEVVLVLNKDSVEHSVTSDDDLFDTGLLDQNQLGMFTAPLTPGEYTYHCTNHPEITGVLVVEENSSE